jgi:trimeric autotransporter adhesin
MSLRQKVSSAIRILRWDRDVSARASHLVVEKDPLITYESVILDQAGSENVSGSTVSFERKLMSTKTSIKRIAAVAAVALAIGGFSAVSAHAAGTQADTLAISATTSATQIKSAVHIYTSQTFLAADAAGANELTLNAYVVSAPAYSTAVPSFTAGTASAVVGAYTDVHDTATVQANTAQIKVINSVVGPTYVQSNNTLTFNPDIAGTYVIKLIQTNNASPTSSAQAASQTWTITAAGTAPVNAVSSKLWMIGGAQNSNGYMAYNPLAFYAYAFEDYTGTVLVDSLTVGDAAAAADPRVVSTYALASSGATAGQYAASIAVFERNNPPAYNTVTATPITASISGPGYVAIGNHAVIGKSVTESAATSGSDGYGSTTKSVYVVSDGTTGTATITISAGGVVLGTKTVIFYSTVASAKGSNNSNIVANDGTGADNQAAEIFLADANGNPVMGAAGKIIGTSSDLTVLKSFTANAGGCADDSVPSASAYVGAPGNYYCDVVGVPGAASGSSATMTFTVKNDAGVVIATSNPVTFKVGGTTISSLALTLDNTTYAPGDKATLTLTAKDSTGNPIADGYYHVFNKSDVTTTAFAGLSTSAQVTKALFAAAGCTVATGVDCVTVGNAGAVLFVDGAAVTTFYAPYTTANLVISGTTSGSSAALSTALKNLGLGTALSVSAAVTAPTDVAAQAAIDAAQEATDAANAAYDAANNAMDSADAATAAAQDASDNASAALAAVTSLSATVAKLVSSVTAIATALAAIKKKLGVK